MFTTKEELDHAIAEAETWLKEKYGDKMEERVAKTKKVLEQVAVANNICCSKTCLQMIEQVHGHNREAEYVYLVILKSYQPLKEESNEKDV
jgi:hypothetical protein